MNFPNPWTFWVIYRKQLIYPIKHNGILIQTLSLKTTNQATAAASQEIPKEKESPYRSWKSAVDNYYIYFTSEQPLKVAMEIIQYFVLTNWINKICLILLPVGPGSCNGIPHRDNNPLDCSSWQVLSFGLVDQRHAQVTQVKGHALQDGLACVRPVLWKLWGQKKLTSGGKGKTFQCASIYSKWSFWTEAILLLVCYCTLSRSEVLPFQSKQFN